VGIGEGEGGMGDEEESEEILLDDFREGFCDSVESARFREEDDDEEDGAGQRIILFRSVSNKFSSVNGIKLRSAEDAEEFF
jgi:hypothetical protein